MSRFFKKPIILKEKDLVRKITVSLIVVALVAILLPIAVMMTSAENGSDNQNISDLSQDFIPDDTAVTYGYLKMFKEQLRQELIDELTAQGGITVTTTYEDISLKQGEMLLLSPNSEIIYRGGNAVVVSSSANSTEGITDMSQNKELFSGEALEYGHVYFASASEAKKAVLVTGSNAYFTVRGDYEIV